MVWFQCEDCGDSLKKPKISAHCRQCTASRLTCIDCNYTFDRWTVQNHTTCVTEYQKYALSGAHKAGAHNSSGTETAPSAPAEAGVEFLSTRAPWKCSACNVTCTSEETLQGHAQGKKHKNKAKAMALRAQQAAQPADPAPAPDPPTPAQEPKSPAENEDKKRKQPDGDGSAKDGADPKAKKGAKTSDKGEEKPVKWKKLAVEQLEKVEKKKLKLEKLKKKLIKQVATDSELSKAELEADLMAKLDKNQKTFTIKGEYIVLAQ